MRNIFKIYHLNLTIDSNYTLLYVKFFIESADFAHSKNEFLIWDIRVSYEMVSHNKKTKKKIKINTFYTRFYYITYKEQRI